MGPITPPGPQCRINDPVAQQPASNAERVNIEFNDMIESDDWGESEETTKYKLVREPMRLLAARDARVRQMLLHLQKKARREDEERVEAEEKKAFTLAREDPKSAAREQKRLDMADKKAALAAKKAAKST